MGHKLGKLFKKGQTPWNKKPGVEKTCPGCGEKFEVPPYRKETAKYCSKACNCRHRVAGWNKGTSGVIKPNIGSFYKGQKSWNKGTRGIIKPNSGSFKKGIIAHNKKYPIKKTCPSCGKLFYVKPSLEKVTCCSRSCARKGKPSPMEGKHQSEESRLKMRIAKLGKVGKLCPNWKGGGTRTERIRFRDQLQKKIFERDNYTCQMCGVKGKSIQVDHIKPWSKYKELRFDPDNCRTLCMACHYQITFNKPMPSKLISWGHNLKHVGVKENIFQTMSQ